jgi:integrase/recombinase XerD
MSQVMDATHPPASMGLDELDTLSDKFRRAQLRQEIAPTTVKIYGWALRDFFRFLERHQVVTANQLTRELVEDWQEDCRRHLSRSSRGIVSTAVRQFLRWGVGQGVIDPRAPYWVTHVKGGRGKPRPIPIEDLRQILAYLTQRAFAGSLVDLRNRALFLYILTTGARVSEAMQVKREDMTRAVVRQKGGTDKDLEVPPVVLEALSDYLAERRDDNPAMWVTLVNNYPMRPLGPPTVREIWRRMAARLGITPWTTHQLRHTGATELYKAGIDGMVVADWLGHKGMSHVTQYTRVSYQRRQEALDVLDGLVRGNSDPKTPRPVLQRRNLIRALRRKPATVHGLHSASAGISQDQKPSKLSDDEPWSAIAGAL